LRGVNTYRFFDHSKPHAGKSSMNAEVAEGAERKRRREKKKKGRASKQRNGKNILCTSGLHVN
jgi:hypothetical protein